MYVHVHTVSKVLATYYLPTYLPTYIRTGTIPIRRLLLDLSLSRTISLLERASITLYSREVLSLSLSLEREREELES